MDDYAVLHFSVKNERIFGFFRPIDAMTRKEAREKLKSEIFNAMSERASLSDVEWIKYIKKEEK